MTHRRVLAALPSLLLCIASSTSTPFAQTAAPAAPILNPTHAYSTYHPYEVIGFSWSGVPHAVTYVLQASRDAAFPQAGTITFDNIPSPGYAFAIGSPEGQYYARVFAIDASGTSSGASNIITFSVFYNNPVGPPPTLASPASGSTLPLPITLTWSHVPNPQPGGYQLQIARDSSFSTIENDSPQLNGPSRTVLSLTPGTKYWRVRSFHGSASPTTSAVTAWSAVRSFIVPSGPPRPVSVGVTKDPMFPGESTYVQVQLSAAAPSTGATIAMTSSHPSIVAVPSTISMPANLAWMQFMVNVSPQVTEPTAVTLTATLNSVTASRVVVVQPASLKSLQMSVPVLAGGNWTSVRVNLNGAAPPGGAVVALSTDNAAVTPPAIVTVPAGFFSGSAWVQTSAVAAPVTATLTGTYKGIDARAAVFVKPPRQPMSLSLNPAATVSGSRATGTVMVADAAGYDEMIALSSSNASVASVPAAVSIRAGMTSANFTIAAGAVTSPTPVTISAYGGGVSRSVTLTVHPVEETMPPPPEPEPSPLPPPAPQPEPEATATLTVSATGRSGERVVSNPSGLSVSVGSTGSASFAASTSVTLSVASGREAVWSGACSSGGSKRRSCTFTITGSANVKASVQ